MTKQSPKAADQARPLIPWMGGKRRLARHIIPMFPPHQCYVEPFAGAAAIFFMKPPAKVEVLNDVHSELVTLYRVVRRHRAEFERHCADLLTSRELYGWLRDTPPAALTDIERAVRFYALQKMGFGGKVASPSFGAATTSPPRLNPGRVPHDLALAEQRLARVYIEHLDWAECVRRYDRPHTLFYCDPPYWQTEGYGVDFGLEQYELLARLARSIKGRMVISVGDVPAMREVFAGLRMETVQTCYTVGGGAKAKPVGELVIFSW